MVICFCNPRVLFMWSTHSPFPDKTEMVTLPPSLPPFLPRCNGNSYGPALRHRPRPLQDTGRHPDPWPRVGGPQSRKRCSGGLGEEAAQPAHLASQGSNRQRLQRYVRDPSSPRRKLRNFIAVLCPGAFLVPCNCTKFAGEPSAKESAEGRYPSIPETKRIMTTIRRWVVDAGWGGLVMNMNTNGALPRGNQQKWQLYMGFRGLSLSMCTVLGTPGWPIMHECATQTKVSSRSSRISCHINSPSTGSKQSDRKRAGSIGASPLVIALSPLATD